MTWLNKNSKDEECTEMKMAHVEVFVVVFLMIPFLAFAEEKKGWPQFMGPNRNGLVHDSPKLLDKWPEGGLKPVWKSAELPYAPTNGNGSPVVADGRVFTFIHKSEPTDGLYPFVDFLKENGWVPGMPEELLKKIDTAKASGERKKLKKKEDIDAFTRKFIEALEPEQQKKYGEAIRIRLSKLYGSFSTQKLKMMTKYEKTEVKTYKEFMNYCYKGIIHNHASTAGLPRKFGQAYFSKHGNIKDQLLCLDAKTGKLLWEKSFPGTVWFTGNQYGCSATPAVADGMVYFRGSAGLYCLDIAKKGKLVWQTKAEPGMGSPIPLDGKVYCAIRELAAFDAKTGKELWRKPDLKHVYQTPTPWIHQGKTYLLFITGKRVHFVDAKNGNILWRVYWKHLNAPGVTVNGDIMLVRSDKASEGGMAYKLSPEKAATLWEKKAGKGDHGGASAVIYNGHVYFGGQAYGKGGMVDVVNLKSGKMTFKGPSGGACGTTPIIVDDKIIYTAGGYKGGGHITLSKIIPGKYELIGRTKPGKGEGLAMCSYPAFADGFLYIRGTKAMLCYDLRQK